MRCSPLWTGCPLWPRWWTRRNSCQRIDPSTASTPRPSCWARVPRICPQIRSDVLSLPAMLCNGQGVFGAKHNRAMTARNRGIVGDCAHGRAYAVQHTSRIIRHMVGYAVGRFGGDDEHRRVFRIVAFFHMIGCGRAFLFVLRNAVSIFARMAQGALVQIARPASPTFNIIKRMARPMVAFARLPEPKQLQPVFMPMRVRTGPLTTSRGAAMWVVACTPLG
jgi:hypothetical protein